MQLSEQACLLLQESSFDGLNCSQSFVRNIETDLGMMAILVD